LFSMGPASRSVLALEFGRGRTSQRGNLLSQGYRC
jgi:hypothetical protein